MQVFGDKNNSAYIEVDNKLIIIDCGFSVFNEIKKRFDLKSYNSINIIITHLHNDHAGSLSQVILYAYYIYGKKVTVISKCKEIKKYLEITGVDDKIYNLKEDMDNLEFIKTEHVKGIDSYGFKIKIKDRNILYTGDTNTLQPFMPYLNNVDEFYVDVSKAGGVHLKIEDIIEVLKTIKKKGIDIYVMHLDDKAYIKNITKGEFFI